MTQQLVPVQNDIAKLDDRRKALIQLNTDAENSTSAEEAREIMIKGRAAADLLAQVKAPFDECRLAGKASVVAARKLGKMLGNLDGNAQYVAKERGSKKSERWMVATNLGMGQETVVKVLRLARAEDPEFQRYIQDESIIPSLHGALLRLKCIPEPKSVRSSSWDRTRRKKVGVKTPGNPSLDEGYSLIVRAIGHLSGSNTVGKSAGSKKRADVARAVDLLYAAEDLLKPYRGGYVA